jgi:hypothetical protein
MGSSQSKDKALRIFITLSKHKYYSGDTVEGAVHLDCKADRPYNRLFIRLYASENAETVVPAKTVARIFQETYKEESLLADFPNGIKKGQYSFPFSLLIPNGFPATLEFNKKNWIRCSISAFFPIDEKRSIKS